MRDIEQELAEMRLAYQSAAQINQFKTALLGRISHELRSPLASLMSLHQLILADLCEDPQEERQFIQQSYQAAQKLMAMIDQVVQISKLESASLPLDLQPISLIKILAELQELTELQAANKNIRLDFVNPSQDIDIIGDRQRLLQALLMLLDGAIRSLDTGTISLTVSREHPGARIIIDIPGLIPQTDSSTPSVSELSQSLALSPHLQYLLAQALITSMKGEVKLTESELEKTTQIEIYLPSQLAEFPAL